MEFTEIDNLFQEAAKVLPLDQSHRAIRDKIQGAISAKHRMENASSDSSSYYNTPYVSDVYGDGDNGQVIHSKDGKTTMSTYKHDGKGNYALSNHKPVKQAYVVDTEEKGEAYVVVVDGVERILHEAVPVLTEASNIVILEEAGSSKDTKIKVTLITEGTGNDGHYTADALRKAVKDGVFKEAKMFLNHQTADERKARPEGDVTKWAGSIIGNPTFVDRNGNEPAKIQGEAKVYPDFAPFIKARKDDLGLSVRVGAYNSGKTQNGKPLVESIAYALSTDFVTQAGRGGKIDEMYESYRQSQAVADDKKELEVMTDDEKKLFTTLQESNAGYATRLDRLEEENNKLRASKILAESFTGTGLSVRAQSRISAAVNINLPVVNGVLDVVKLQESIKVAITDEVTYLQESGVRISPFLIKNLGGTGAGTAAEPENDDTLLQEAQARTTKSIHSIMGKEPAKEKTA